MGVWIADASPLILLAKADALELLVAEGRSLLLPVPVVQEVLAGAADHPARVALESVGERIPVDALPDSIASLGLGTGEAAVLAVALEREDSLAVLGDDRARRAARTLGVEAMGTLGVVLLAKGQGRIPVAAPVIKRLRDVGLYISDAAVRTALLGISEPAD